MLQLFTGGMDCKLKKWDTDGKSLAEWTEEKNALTNTSTTSTSQIVNPPFITSLAASSRYLAAARCDGVALFHVETGKQLFYLDDHQEPVCHALLPKPGSTLFTAGNDGSVFLWKLPAQPSRRRGRSSKKPTNACSPGPSLVRKLKAPMKINSQSFSHGTLYVCGTSSTIFCIEGLMQ